jgi:hypothetical protein
MLLLGSYYYGPTIELRPRKLNCDNIMICWYTSLYFKFVSLSRTTRVGNRHIKQYSILYNTVILFYSILYYTILYYTILYHRS